MQGSCTFTHGTTTVTLHRAAADAGSPDLPIPADVLASVAPSCVHNGALAFCNVAARLAPERKVHLLITLQAPVPIPIRVTKVSAERAFPALDADPRPGRRR